MDVVRREGGSVAISPKEGNIIADRGGLMLNSSNQEINDCQGKGTNTDPIKKAQSSTAIFPREKALHGIERGNHGSLWSRDKKKESPRNGGNEGKKKGRLSSCCYLEYRR